MSTEKMVTIQVSVPESREREFWTDFYVWVAGWRSDVVSMRHEVQPVGVDAYDNALQNAVKWWRSMNGSMRGFVTMLLDASPEYVPSQEIVDELGLAGVTSIKGVIAHPYPKAMAEGFYFNWNRHELPDGQTGYQLAVKPETVEAIGLDVDREGYVELVRTARAQAEAAEAAESEKFGA